MNVRSRLGRLERHCVSGTIAVKLKGGGTATLPSRRILDIFLDVMRGRNTLETRIALSAASSNESGRMLELMQAVGGSPSMPISKGPRRVQ
ncbi:MAG: hypothetical protein ACR2JE_17355 [Acidobacteriaceae bacterium]